MSELTQDGYASGELTGINIENNGMIMTRYSNGVTRAEGQLALASFRNTQGLASIGGNNWVETFESGQPVKGTATDGNFGSLRSGALEESNVDLTAELVNMMTAQRAYQANAQTIKTQAPGDVHLVKLEMRHPESLRLPFSYALRAREWDAPSAAGGAAGSGPCAAALAWPRQLHAQWTACGIAGN